MSNRWSNSGGRSLTSSGRSINIGPVLTEVDVDTFEDRDFAEYDTNSSDFQIVQDVDEGFATPTTGDWMLKAPQDANNNNVAIFSHPGDGHELYPAKGDIIEYYVRSDTAGAGFNIFYFGADTTAPADNSYELRLDHVFDKFNLYKHDGGTSTTLQENNFAPAPDTWYRIRIVWDDGSHGGSENEISISLSDESGTEVSTIGPIIDATHATNSSIGWEAADRNNASLYFDDLRIWFYGTHSETVDVTPEGSYKLTIDSEAGSSGNSYSVTVSESAVAFSSIETDDTTTTNADGTVTMDGRVGGGYKDEWTCEGDLVSYTLADGHYLRINDERVGISGPVSSGDGGGGGGGGGTGGDGTFTLTNTLDTDTDLDWFNDGFQNYASIATSPVRTSDSMKVDCPEGENLGTQLFYRFDFGTPGYQLEEAWAQYLVYFDQWDMTKRYNSFPNEGKFPGFCTTNGCGLGGNRCTGDEGFSARMGFGGDAGTGKVQLTSYVYHANEQRGHFDWDMNNNAGYVTKNEWHTIDQHVKMNTPGETDGLIEGWVDGTKAFNQNFKFRNVGADFGIREWFHNVWWGGGSTDPSPADNVVYFDNVILSDGPISTY